MVLYGYTGKGDAFQQKDGKSLGYTPIITNGVFLGKGMENMNFEFLWQVSPGRKGEGRRRRKTGEGEWIRPLLQ